jgi:hypothetical protein
LGVDRCISSAGKCGYVIGEGGTYTLVFFFVWLKCFWGGCSTLESDSDDLAVFGPLPDADCCFADLDTASCFDVVCLCPFDDLCRSAADDANKVCGEGACEALLV